MLLPFQQRTIRIIYLLFGIAILSFIPFNLVIAPERNLTFLSSNELPVENAIIEQTWYQYALGIRGNIDLKVNYEGHVLLPMRVVRTNIISLLRGSIIQFKSLGIHAGFGSSEIITLFLNDQPVKWFYDGKGLESGRIYIDFPEKTD